MAKVKVTTKWQILDFIDGFMDNTTANAIGQTVVDAAKEMIASGQSPVRGYGRFEEYAAAGKAKQYRKAATESAKAGDKITAKGLRASAKETLSKGYPMSVQKQFPDKQVRPVNLWLSGSMLEGYDFRVTSDSIQVGMVGGSEKDKEIAGYHQEGTDKMAQRRLVPGDGEEFAESIMRAIRDEYGTRIAQIIRQANKKE